MSLSQAVGSGCPPVFTTNGQVDWIAFGKTTWSITSTGLQRFSAAEVQPATYGAALALGTRFRLGSDGERRVDKAISQLKASFSFQKILWFGFGQKSFLYLLAETRVGLNCLALCACLADTHSAEVAGYILSELWRVCDFPSEYEPSHEQFTNLVRTCEGAFARTTFGPTVERMTASRRLEARESRNENYACQNWERCADPKDIAPVLKALFDISMNQIQSIQVSGTSECAFIGGLAEWLFDLRTASTDHDGSCPIPDPQVLLQYSLDPPDVESKSLTRIESTSYYLSSTDDFWSQLHSPTSSSSLLILRVPWEQCLSRSFGIYFDKLCALAFTLGEFFGSAARIYAGLALGEPNIGTFDGCRENFVDFLDNCHGPGLILAISSVFPELRRIADLERVMQIAEARSFSESVVALTNSYVALSKQCDCPRCHPTDLHSYRTKACLPAIAFMILRVARFLGATQQDSELLPTISGLRFFQERLPPMGASIDQKHLEALLQLDYCPLNRVIADPIVLFSGTLPFLEDQIKTEWSDPSTATAISCGGVCAYTESLRRPAEHLSSYRIVHVAPGQIQKGRRRFNGVYDRPVAQDASNPGLHFFDFNQKINLGMGGYDVPDLQAVVTERGQCLYFAYAIPARSSKPLAPTRIWLLPGITSHIAIRRTCLVPCGRGGSCAGEPDLDCYPTPTHLFNPQEPLSTENVRCYVSGRPQSSLEQLIRLQLQLCDRHREKALFIRRDECLPCCTKVMLRDSDRLRREIQLTYERWETTRVLFHLLNAEGLAHDEYVQPGPQRPTLPPSSH